MKKIIIGLLAIPILLVACSVVTDSDTTSDSGNAPTVSNSQVNETAPETEALYQVGESATLSSGVTYTLNSVTITDERNEFAETTPTNVVLVSYTVTNNSDEEYFAGGDVTVYDGTATKAKTYPVAAISDMGGSVAAGKKIDVVAAFGVETNPLEIQFAPLMSFDDEVSTFEATF